MSCKQTLAQLGRKSRVSCFRRWASQALGFGSGVDSDRLISLRFWPEIWAGIWAAMVMASANPENGNQEAREIDLVIISPIERALADAGFGHLLWEAQCQMGIEAEVKQLERLRRQY